jgi:hypothetical protein
MTGAARQNEDAYRSRIFCDASLSLPLSLHVLAGDAGYEIDCDDLNAAMGLSWMTTAVPGEDDPARWAMYARDAFLVEAARLFGMTIRDIHPPEAARGLDGLPEFEQHFDASYRPLILRALEHRQPVLAWQGWPGDRRMLWGIITETGDGGVGFSGRVPRSSEARPCADERGSTVPSTSTVSCHDRVTLESPPVQLYIVETITPTQPDPQELLDLALGNGRRIFDNALADRFGVITGTAAYDAWIARRQKVGRASPAEAQPEAPCLAEPDLPALAHAHRQLAGSVLTAHKSAIRFLERHHPRVSGDLRSRLDVLTRSCHTIVTSLREWLDAADAAASLSTPGGWAKLTNALARAAGATKDMRDALN